MTAQDDAAGFQFKLVKWEPTQNGPGGQYHICPSAKCVNR
jgi:hypothetical protein